jgi:hypothetical protein
MAPSIPDLAAHVKNTGSFFRFPPPQALSWPLLPSVRGIFYRFKVQIIKIVEKGAKKQYTMIYEKLFEGGRHTPKGHRAARIKRTTTIREVM